MLPDDWRGLVEATASLGRMIFCYTPDGCPVDAGVLAQDDHNGSIWCLIDCLPELTFERQPGVRHCDAEAPVVMQLHLKLKQLRQACGLSHGVFACIPADGRNDQKYGLVLANGLVQAVIDARDFHVFVPCGPLRLMAGGVETPVYQPLGHANDDQQEAPHAA